LLHFVLDCDRSSLFRPAEGRCAASASGFGGRASVTACIAIG
jgi:hypothetical protein